MAEDAMSAPLSTSEPWWPCRIVQGSRANSRSKGMPEVQEDNDAALMQLARKLTPLLQGAIVPKSLQTEPATDRIRWTKSAALKTSSIAGLGISKMFAGWSWIWQGGDVCGLDLKSFRNVGETLWDQQPSIFNIHQFQTYMEGFKTYICR